MAPKNSTKKRQSEGGKRPGGKEPTQKSARKAPVTSPRSVADITTIRGGVGSSSDNASEVGEITGERDTVGVSDQVSQKTSQEADNARVVVANKDARSNFEASQEKQKSMVTIANQVEWVKGVIKTEVFAISKFNIQKHTLNNETFADGLLKKVGLSFYNGKGNEVWELVRRDFNAALRQKRCTCITAMQTKAMGECDCAGSLSLYVQNDAVGGLIVSLFLPLIAFAALFKKKGGMKFGKDDYQGWSMEATETAGSTELLLWVCSEFLMCVVSQSKFDKNMEMGNDFWKWVKGSDICFLLAVLKMYYGNWKERAEVEKAGDKWIAKTKKEAMKVAELRNAYTDFFKRYNALMLVRKVQDSERVDFTKYHEEFGPRFHSYWTEKQDNLDDDDNSVFEAESNAKKRAPQRADQVLVDWGEMGMVVQI